MASAINSQEPWFGFGALPWASSWSYLYCHSRAKINIYWVGWKLGAAIILLQSSKDNYSGGVCKKIIFYERGWQMWIPLTLVIIAISGHILTWGRHSWAGWYSRAGLETELNPWLLTYIHSVEMSRFLSSNPQPLPEVNFLGQTLSTDGFSQHMSSSARSLQVTRRARPCCNTGIVKTEIQLSAEFVLLDRPWPQCPCATSTGAFRSAADLSRAGFLE